MFTNRTLSGWEIPYVCSYKVQLLYRSTTPMATFTKWKMIGVLIISCSFVSNRMVVFCNYNTDLMPMHLPGRVLFPAHLDLIFFSGLKNMLYEKYNILTVYRSYTLYNDSINDMNSFFICILFFFFFRSSIRKKQNEYVK